MIRRTPAGWRVVTGKGDPDADPLRPVRTPAGGARTAPPADPPADDLTSAMVLADLLAAEYGQPPAPARPPGPATSLAARPGTAPATAPDDPARLRVTIRQLEHALANRVVVEQAIGVLAERHRISPRRAFDRLRQAARSRGRRVHDLAGDVVASVVNPLLPIPQELCRGGPGRPADRLRRVTGG